RRNEAALRSVIPGFRAESLLGLSIDPFLENPTRDHADFARQELLPIRRQIEVSDRVFTIAVTPILDSQGQWMGNCLEWWDLTDQRRAEEQVASLISSAVAGDLHHRVDSRNFEGFMGGLVDGINRLMDAVVDPIRQTAGLVESLSRGCLTETMAAGFEGEFGELERSVNSCVENLRAMVHDVQVVACHLHEASANIAQGNTDLSRRTEAQAASLEETASTMEELTATVRQNAENARRADELALAAKVSADKGGCVVGDAVGAMSEINASSKRIEDIIGVIDEIAFQTNLLALNAAVEAARAGEQGRGFAVVANEVRNLAQRSAGAAKEIKALIKDSVAKVEEGTRLVDASGQTLSEIFNSVQHVSDLIAEIANASGEQTRGIEQINRAIAQLDHMTQQNAALVEEAAAAAESLDEQTLQLNEMMGFFEVGGLEKSMPTPTRVGAGAATRGRRQSSGGSSGPRHAPPIRRSTSLEATFSDDGWEEF
ncbi:MAG: methyl-accepting chemotaxis protein, partial [Planctomycetes bacterium]|nr:methyl-accepting chemotaxis protein [Planctomycetota bacterium]